MRFFSEYFICHFYFFWSKILCIIFTPKTICCSRLFSNFYWFNFWFCVFHFLQCGKCFLTTLFNAFVIMEWFDLNFNFNSLFQILSIKYFLDDFLMCLCILFISLKMLKYFSSGLILLNTKLSSLSNAFCLYISQAIFLSWWANSLTSIASLYSWK